MLFLVIPDVTELSARINHGSILNIKDKKESLASCGSEGL